MSDREILFRGKNRSTQKWHYGSLVKTASGLDAFITKGLLQLDCINKCQRVCFDIAQVDPETVGRFTGLTDKNGIKIFEGDIVHLYGDKNNVDTRSVDYNALVIFKDGGFCAIDGTPDDYGFRRYYFSNCDLNCEVIGNIYDNPELLREEDEE